jgi:thiol-disulfide isomerase/thioredoxin
MTMRALLSAGVVSVLTLWAGRALAAGNAGEKAPEFPPGVFSDGGQYKVSDFDGKLLVLFFFESECPTCKGTIPQRNAVVEAFKDKPVKFIAVGPHNSLNEAKSYVAETKLVMPVFADNLNIMETMYGQTISLQNIYQFRVIGPDGQIVGYRMTTEDITKALEQVKWKYKGGDWDPRLAGIVELLEWNQYDKAMNQLRPLRKAQSKSLAESAEKLYQQVHTEGEAWKQKADGLSDGKPIEAYDLYLKIASVFAGDDLAKAANEALKSLKTNKAVTDELAARQMYAQLYTAVPRAKPQQRSQVATFCAAIVNKYPNTPTAEKAKSLGEAIEKAPGQ